MRDASGSFCFRPAVFFAALLPGAALSVPALAADESEPLQVLEFLNHFDWSSTELSCAVESTAYPDFRTFRLSGLNRLVPQKAGQGAGPAVEPRCEVKRNHAVYCSWSAGLTQYGLSLTPGETRAYRSADGHWSHVVPGVLSKSFTANSAVACTALSTAGTGSD